MSTPTEALAAAVRARLAELAPPASHTVDLAALQKQIASGLAKSKSPSAAVPRSEPRGASTTEVEAMSRGIARELVRQSIKTSP